MDTTTGELNDSFTVYRYDQPANVMRPVGIITRADALDGMRLPDDPEVPLCVSDLDGRHHDDNRAEDALWELLRVYLHQTRAEPGAYELVFVGHDGDEDLAQLIHGDPAREPVTADTPSTADDDRSGPSRDHPAWGLV